MTAPIIPVYLVRVKTFTSLTCWNFQQGEWVRAAESDPDLDSQMNACVDDEHIQIQNTSAPDVKFVERSDTRRVYLASIAVMYIPAVEESVDVQPAG